MAPNLDSWLSDPTIRVAHSVRSSAPPDRLWHAAQSVKVRDSGLLGRLIRWRIPGTPPQISFGELFRAPPFTVLAEDEWLLVSGLVGRIWTLKRDYPRLHGADEFRDWSAGGTAKVLFAHWVADGALHSEARVRAVGRQGRLGVAAVRPLVMGFHGLIASDGLAAAVRLAERSP